MKTLKIQVVKVNGAFDIYADKNTRRVQNYCDLASEIGRNWDEMSKRSRSNFRKRHCSKLQEIPTQIEVFEISATVPAIFGEYQLKQAVIDHLIHPASGVIFLRCKNGVTGYSTDNFNINKLN